MFTERVANKSQFLLMGLLIVSAGLNVVLASKLKALNEAIVSVKTEQSLTEGTIVPAIAANTLIGNAEVIRFDSVSTPTVLYVFTPPCGWCTRNLPAVIALQQNLSGKYRILGLSLSSDGLQKYVTESGLTFPVYADPSRETRNAYHLGGTPNTIVISAEGKVIKHWQGAYIGSTKREIESFFAVSLPAVSEK